MLLIVDEAIKQKFQKDVFLFQTKRRCYWFTTTNVVADLSGPQITNTLQPLGLASEIQI